MQTIYHRFYSYLKPHFFQLFVVIIALLITASSVLSFGLTLRYIIDRNQDMNFLSFLPIFLLICIFAVASFIRSYSIYAICEKVICKIRRDAYEHLVNIAPYHFEIRQTSDIISRLTNDSLLVAGVISDTFSFALRNGLTAIGCAILMIYISPKLGLSILCIIPTLVPMIVLIGKKVKQISKQNQEEISGISADIEETFNAIKTIQSFNLQEYKTSNFGILSKYVLDSNLKRLVIRSSLTAVIIFLILSGILLVVILGLGEIKNNAISSGDLTSFIFYALMGATSLAGIADIASDLQRSNAAAERLFGLFDIGIDTRNNAQQNTDNLKSFDISFENVSFTYPGRQDSQILNSISFQIKQGEFIGIVGRSGCGKTTIISLLQKFYEYQEGKILIGNIDINLIQSYSLRNILALVPQDPFIFSASAKDNILIGNRLATEEEMFEASKKAGIYEFLNSLPEGFNTHVGEKGVMLSGGQKQRIAIARAFLKNPKILLLDEATSALDSMNEEEIHTAIQELGKNITVIAIAHRISTIKDADKIIVMKDGTVSAIGIHNELLKTSDLYKELVSA